MWFQVEDSALHDERVKLLAKRLGTSFDSALVALLRVWAWLYKQGGRPLTEEEVDVTSGVPGFSAQLVECDLAEAGSDGLRIRGSARAKKYGAFRERQQKRAQEAHDKRRTEGVITNDLPTALPMAEPTALPKTRLISSEILVSRSLSLDLSEYLLTAIRTHTPGLKGNVERWAKDIDLALRIDGRTPEEIRSVVDYAHRNPDGAFWASNLLSGQKLRKHCERLLIALRKAPRSAVVGGNEGGRVMTAEELAEWAAEEMARERERGER